MSLTDSTHSPNTLFRAEINNLQAYHVPVSAGLIKLDAMENPYSLPQVIRAEIADLVASAAINRYPDPGAAMLKAKISKVLELPQGAEILLGNGSDELIQLLALAVNKPGATLLSVEPSFVMYKMIAAFAGMQYVGVPLADDFGLDIDKMLTTIEQTKPAIIFLAYPNNPTGNLFSSDEIIQIIQAAPGLVVVDEAYYAFASDSFIPHLARFENLLVMRTFSKLGMAGLRLGFLVGSAIWVNALEKLRLPYNVGVLPQLVAEKLLEHHDILVTQANQIKVDRTGLSQQLAAIVGVKVYPSEANFLLFRIENATEIFEALKQRGILIKNLNGGQPKLRNCLRVTIGTAEENIKFMSALHAIL